MNSGASWNERGLSPELYQAAREAADRAGMSVEEWLKSTFGNSAAAAGVRPQGQTGPLGTRLDELSQRFARSGEHDTAPENGAASVRGARLADTVAKLNARLEQLTAGRSPAEVDRTAPERAPPIAPQPPDLGIDQAIAEIAARQQALDSAPPPAAPPPAAPEPPHTANPDFASLERQLHHITEQIETLRHPSGVEDAIAGLRSDLSDIARAIHEALPRRSLESLQSDVQALAERIDHGYGRGADPSALEVIERNLAEIHARLNAMTPAESLAGFDERVSELSHKMDSLAVGSPDPETLRYLEAAINELRELSAGVASAEGVASLAGDVQALSTRIDHIAERTGATGLDSLALRVNELTHALDNRVEQIGPLPSNLESLVRTLTEKLNHSDGFARDQAAFEHLERQIHGIAEKIEAADQKFGDLGGIERGIQQLTLQVREAREESAATAERVARRVAADMAEAVPKTDAEVIALKRDLADSEQRTHETLEAVHDTLERLVERLAMVETGAKSAPQPAYVPQSAYAPEFARDSIVPAPEVRAPESVAAAPEPAYESSVPAVRPTPFMHVQRTERPPIDPDLPADTPLEPGSAGRGRSPAERIAASEAALAPLKREGAPEITGKANFIAAARRAAQAAANEGTPVETQRTDEGKDDETPSSLIGRFLANRRRALMVGVSALLVLYGAIQIAGMFGSSDHAAEKPATSSQIQAPEPRKIAAPAAAPAPAPVAAAPQPAPAAPAPEPARQSAADPMVAPIPSANLIAPTPVAPPAPVQPATAASADVTGSVKPPMNIAPQAPAPIAAAASQAQPTGAADKLPPGIGGPALRSAAAAGNPAAEYEIGVRYSEGRGVPANLELAVQWFDRAAKQGLAPALYRLGSLYEKGLGVKKDLDKARQLYVQGADKGNAKAVHNLAVLYAEGIDGKPDYRTAAQWFRKAADRGVADSQYNLGILYARGIGVEQNLAESYKWFALAAQQGDQDAAKKREDVAGRLDQQSLVAARLAVQTWAADPPPDEAMNVKAPPGGWDHASAAPAKPAATARRKPTSI